MKRTYEIESNIVDEVSEKGMNEKYRLNRKIELLSRYSHHEIKLVCFSHTLPCRREKAVAK